MLRICNHTGGDPVSKTRILVVSFLLLALFPALPGVAVSPYEGIKIGKGGSGGGV